MLQTLESNTIFSDWYRDYEASVEYWNLPTKEYSYKKIDKVDNIMSFFSDDDFSLVKITLLATG